MFKLDARIPDPIGIYGQTERASSDALDRVLEMIEDPTKLEKDFSPPVSWEYGFAFNVLKPNSLDDVNSSNSTRSQYEQDFANFANMLLAKPPFDAACDAKVLKYYYFAVKSVFSPAPTYELDFVDPNEYQVMFLVSKLYPSTPITKGPLKKYQEQGREILDSKFASIPVWDQVRILSGLRFVDEAKFAQLVTTIDWEAFIGSFPIFQYGEKCELLASAKLVLAESVEFQPEKGNIICKMPSKQLEENIVTPLVPLE